MKFEKEIDVIFVNAGPKSWLIGIDIASRLRKLNQEVRIIFLGRTPTSKIRIPSPRRIWFQKKFVHKLDIKVSHLQWTFSVFDIASVAKAFKVTRFVWLTNDWTDELRTVRAQLAALYGTSELKPRDLSRSKLFFFVLIKILVQTSLPKIFSETSLSSYRVWVFNGREILESSVLEWAIVRGIQTRIFERGSSSSKFEIYEKSPHCNNEWWRKIESFHNQLSEEDCEADSEEVHKYIIKKSHGVDPFISRKWQRFAKGVDTESSKITDSFICFFSVSTGEFSPFEAFDSAGGFNNQFLALSELLGVSKELGKKLIIRRHPNSLGIDGVDRENNLWTQFINDENVVYFGPLAKINSYSLATRAVCSFTWRSTIGFDLNARGLPTFAMGPAKWALCDDLKAYERGTIKERIKRPIISSEAQEAVHRYAHYFTKFGTPLQNFNYVERWGFETNGGKRYRYFLN